MRLPEPAPGLDDPGAGVDVGHRDDVGGVLGVDDRGAARHRDDVLRQQRPEHLVLAAERRLEDDALGAADDVVVAELALLGRELRAGDELDVVLAALGVAEPYPLPLLQRPAAGAAHRPLRQASSTRAGEHAVDGAVGLDHRVGLGRTCRHGVHELRRRACRREGVGRRRAPAGLEQRPRGEPVDPGVCSACLSAWPAPSQRNQATMAPMIRSNVTPSAAKLRRKGERSTRPTAAMRPIQAATRVPVCSRPVTCQNDGLEHAAAVERQARQHVEHRDEDVDPADRPHDDVQDAVPPAASGRPGRPPVRQRTDDRGGELLRRRAALALDRRLAAEKVQRDGVDPHAEPAGRHDVGDSWISTET